MSPDKTTNHKGPGVALCEPFFVYAGRVDL